MSWQKHIPVSQPGLEPRPLNTESWPSLISVYKVGFKTDIKPANHLTQTCLRISESAEETTFLSPAEELFKLYDGVETFVMFIGYPRSRHSLVAAILDAHPHIIVTQSYDVIKHCKEYRSSPQKKYQLFFGIHQQSREIAMFKAHASRIHQLRNDQGYYYNVPGSWQGGYQERIKAS